MVAIDVAPRIVAVTGVSRGIGAAIARELARRGHTVGAFSRKGRGIEEGQVPPELAERMIPVACDVEDEASVRAALQALVDRTGRLDGIVNNAGRLLEVAADQLATADFRALLETNVVGSFVVCREAYPHLKANGGGLIVSIGSFIERIGVRYTVAYAASKAAIGAMTRVLATEWVKDDIRVLDVAPGFIATAINAQHRERESFAAFMARRIPAGRPGRPEEVAQLVGLLFQEDMPYLTGETIFIDGAISIAQ